MRLFRLKDQSGQATIEYVLLLIVSVSLLLLLMTQIFTPLQKFLNAYMGSYVQCLLEYGELPGLSGDSDAASECNAKFEDFTLAGGRPPKSGGSGGGGSSGSGGSSSGSDEEGSGSSARRSSAGSGGSGRSRALNVGGGTVGADGSGEQKVIEIEVSSAGAGTGTFMRRNSTELRSSSRQQSFSIDQSQISESERKRLQSKKNRADRAQASILETTEPKAPTRFSVEPPPPAQMPDVNEEEFTFGNFFRMIIIIGIILAIIVFVGGQFLQMSKNSSD